MFQSIEELIDENDRRRSLELDDVGDDEDASQAEPHTPEYDVLLTSLFYLALPWSSDSVVPFSVTTSSCDTYLALRKNSWVLI